MSRCFEAIVRKCSMPHIVRPHTTQKISSSASLAVSAEPALKFTPTPSRPPAIAVATPTRAPPKAAAKNTAGKYGVKNTSGRIRARPHRAAVAIARQQAAKPTLKSGDGCDIPYQPRRNSLIHFPMFTLHHRSESRIRPGLKEIRQVAIPVVESKRWLALFRNAGDTLKANFKRGERHGAAGRQGRGHHRRDQRHRIAHRGDFR